MTLTPPVKRNRQDQAVEQEGAVMASREQREHNPKDAKILIVDDELSSIEVVQAFLEEENYHRILALDDSTRAMEVMAEFRPDLLLLDLLMPVVSGYDILTRVRGHDKFKHLPVIILTASSDTGSKLKALDLGATDFLAKPLDPSELRLRVRNTLFAKAYQDQLAFYDGLTKLPNRALFLEELAWNVKGAMRHQEQLALLNIEIDRFDKVNDRIGHSAGDEVLCKVAERIKNVIRHMDVLGRAVDGTEGEMSLFHLESNVFSLVLTRVRGEESAAVTAERVLRAIRVPMRVEGRELYVTASIGIATYPDSGPDIPTLVRLASSAKDIAKQTGGDAFQFSSSTINEAFERRLSLEARLRKALMKGEFELHYQPQVDVASGRILSAEALVRWNSDQGFVPTDELISLAEETGLIVPIGEWVVTQACRQLRLWHQSGKAPIGLAVNLSARQFLNAEFIASIKRIIVSSGIASRYLTLELTESLLFENVDSKIGLLQSLKETGVKLSIDDFGTGFSSLSYLTRLPLDEIKIDRSFVRQIVNSAESRAIVATILALARNLNFATVAEGIEAKAELEFLQKQGCQRYQGFLFSRPVPANEFFSMLPVRG